MKTLGEANPICAFLWLLLAAGIAMFVFNPILLLLSLIGALMLLLTRNRTLPLRSLLPAIILLVASTLINPLFSHNGATVLFVINDNPVTLEAVWYGLVLGGLIATALLWFQSFQQIMTGDKLLYVFGSALPKLTLILSITLRYIPLFRRQSAKVRQAQKALGLFRDENMPDRIRGELRIFSVLVSWALENGIVTADSMAARGYGIGRRTRFALFRFRAGDFLSCGLALALGSITIVAAAQGALDCSFYPRFAQAAGGTQSTIAYAAYGALCLLPVIMELEENIRWLSLKSKI